MFLIEKGIGLRGREAQFTQPGLDEDFVVVHPWDRNGDRSVYVEVRDSENEFHNVIVDREEFVRGLLAVFPELARAEH